MALATFKDLCMDASDAAALGAFWARALGLRAESAGAPDVVLRGRTPAHTIWVNQVPEPKTVKNRVHLDVHTGDLATLTSAGATIVPDQDFRWTVMLDPDGQEFCAFMRETVPAEPLYEVAVDCADPVAQAAWWGRVLGVDPQRDPKEGWCWLEGLPGAPFESLVFVRVPEPKTTKNRIHLDLTSADVGALLDAGATMLRRSTDGPPEQDRVWDVLADPEGNEFCVFPA
jgi:hypothetical protein